MRLCARALCVLAGSRLERISRYSAQLDTNAAETTPSVSKKKNCKIKQQALDNEECFPSPVAIAVAVSRRLRGGDVTLCAKAFVREWLIRRSEVLSHL